MSTETPATPDLKTTTTTTNEERPQEAATTIQQQQQNQTLEVKTEEAAKPSLSSTQKVEEKEKEKTANVSPTDDFTVKKEVVSDQEQAQMQSEATKEATQSTQQTLQPPQQPLVPSAPPAPFDSKMEVEMEPGEVLLPIPAENVQQQPSEQQQKSEPLLQIPSLMVELPLPPPPPPPSIPPSQQQQQQQQPIKTEDLPLSHKYLLSLLFLLFLHIINNSTQNPPPPPTTRD